MMTLLEAAQQKRAGTVRKLANYFPEYDRNFGDYRDKEINLLEIGIQGGGSLHMWREYFPHVSVVGVDIDPDCLQYADGDRVKVEIGDQADEQFLQQLEQKHGPFDIIIDDGGHTMLQQLTTIKTLFPALSMGGMYVIEDLHTSYWPKFGGRVGKAKTAIGFVKQLIDEIHYWAIDNPRATLLRRLENKIARMRGKTLPPAMPKNIWQTDVRSIYIADSICFIKKEWVEKDKIVRF